MSDRTPARPAICFEAQMRKVGRWTIVELPIDASAELPSRRQVAVRGAFSRRDFETVLEPDGRRGHWLRIDEKLRRAIEERPTHAPKRDRNRLDKGRALGPPARERVLVEPARDVIGRVDPALPESSGRCW